MRWLCLAALLLGCAHATTQAQFAQSTYDFTVANCAEEVAVCSELSEAAFRYYNYELNGAPWAPTWRPCGGQQTVGYDMSLLPNDGYAGPNEIVSWSVEGQPVTGTFNSPSELADLLLGADPAGAWLFDLANVRVSGGAPGRTYTDLVVRHVPTNETITLPAVTSTTGATAEFRLGAGTSVVRVLDGAAEAGRVTVTVTCPAGPTWEAIAVTTPSTTRLCPDLGALGGPIVASSVRVQPAPRQVELTLRDDDCFDLRAFGDGVDSVALTYCDAAARCATAYYVVTARPSVVITPSTVFDTVGVDGDVVTYCVDTGQLPGTITSVRDVCATGSETYVEFTLVGETACLKYRGLVPGGTDTSCVVVCDDLGFCDTTTVIVTTTTQVRYPDLDVAFTIDVGAVGSTLLDLSAFRQNVTAITNACPEQSGSFVDFRVDAANRSIDFAGLAVGTERACIEAVAVDGSRQTTRITVRVVTRSPGRDTIRMRNGDTRAWCFGIYELTGPPVRLTDACPAASPVVGFTTAPGDASCGEFRATRIGLQELCMTLCDAGGTCDLIDLVVEVVPNGDDRLPDAVDDVALLPASGRVTINALANDLSRDPITYVTIAVQPSFGTASFDVGGELTYVAFGDDCLDDVLVYEICNGYGCDQATVRYVSDCEPGVDPRPKLLSATGFSPNGDGINDTWVLRNIEFYPGSTVGVYNRWGARVLEVTDYGNDWDGTFGEALLPDGTYYYVVELVDEPAVAGYVQIRR